MDALSDQCPSSIYVDTSDTRGLGRPLLPSMLSATVPALAGLLVEKGLTASLGSTVWPPKDTR
jgi:hypothetical protein